MKTLISFVVFLLPSLALAQSVPEMSRRVTLDGPNGLNWAFSTKLDANNAANNPTYTACPIGSCPAIGSALGPVKSTWTMQGETKIDTGQGEMMINLGMLVDKGASGGATTYGKLPLYVGMMQARGGGSAWAFNTNAIRNAVPGGANSINGLPGSGTEGSRGAMGSVSTIAYENDLTNWDEDTATSSAFVVGYYGHMQGSYASTAYFNMDATMPAGIFGAHYGEYWQPNSVEDTVWVENTAATTGTLYKGNHTNATIEDDGTGSTAFLLKGKKSIASILDQSSSPAFLQSSGTYSIATINDQATSPAALNLGGSYSLAAINDSMTTTDNVAFISVKAQHKVCFNGQSACLYYDATNKKIYGTNSSGVITWSIDDSGNAVFKGTVTSGTP